MAAYETFKGEANLADLIAQGGARGEEVFNQIWAIAITKAKLKDAARVIPMKSRETRVARLAFSGDMLKAAPNGATNSSAHAFERRLSAANRMAPNFLPLVLNSQPYVGHCPLPFETIEEAAGDDNLDEVVMEALGGELAKSMQKIALNSDKTSAEDPYFQQDGWKALAGITIDAQGAPLSRELLVRAYDAIQEPFDDGIEEFKFYVSKNNLSAYREVVAARPTVYGDSAYNGNGKLAVSGIELMQTANMGDRDVLLTKPNNLLLGMRKDFRLARVVNEVDRVVDIVTHGGFAIGVEEPRALVRIKNIGPADGDAGV